jgi:hypothetical protein
MVQVDQPFLFFMPTGSPAIGGGLLDEVHPAFLEYNYLC